MKKAFLVICLSLCAFILLGCTNDPASSKIISRCSNAWHALGLDHQDIKPNECNWYYRQYSDTTSLTQTAFKGWSYKPTAQDLNWLPESGYFVFVGGVTALFGDDNSYIGYYYKNGSGMYFAYGERRLSKITNSFDRDIAKSQNEEYEILFECIMKAESNYSYVSFDNYDIENDTSYCKLSNGQKNQIK